MHPFVQDLVHNLRRALIQVATAVNFNIAESGPTTSRPTDANLKVGQPYFDTTLGKPIWLKTIGPPQVWVDATGTPV